MEKIKILYIDDSPDTAFSKFLDNYSQDNYEFESIDIEFKSEDGYESLINSTDVRSANVIFIDSRLFENRNASEGKFTGEEFKIILKKYFPFIEVIVISQNDIDDKYETVAKYNANIGIPPEKYYESIIPPKMKYAIMNIHEARKIALLMEKNTSWESVLIEKITNSINGYGTYDELTKTDIDKVIDVFKVIQEKIDG
jgi:hypothetical protein